MGLVRWYKLRRHRLGIGVHSPFAYRLVRDVIYGQGHYYAAAKLHGLTEGYPRRMRRVYRIIFRLVARLAPEGVRLSGGVEPQIELLVRLADTRPLMGRGLGGYLPGRCVLTICDAADLRDGLPEGMLRSGNMVVVRDLNYRPEALTAIKEAMKGGWLFAESRMVIAVSDDAEPMNVIEVKMV